MKAKYDTKTIQYAVKEIFKLPLNKKEFVKNGGQ